jgi:hypothetical protein
MQPTINLGLWFTKHGSAHSLVGDLNSPSWIAYISFDFSFENLIVHQDSISWFKSRHLTEFVWETKFDVLIVLGNIQYNWYSLPNEPYTTKPTRRDSDSSYLKPSGVHENPWEHSIHENLCLCPAAVLSNELHCGKIKFIHVNNVLPSNSDALSKNYTKQFLKKCI